MAITITIAGSDRTAYVPLMGDSEFGLPGLKIQQDAASYVSRCSFGIRDDLAALTIATKQVVVVADGATTLFGGEIASIERYQVGPARCMAIDVQDYNILLEETVAPKLTFAVGTADSAIIADLFAAYRTDINAVAYVATIDASMETMSFQNTLRQCLSQICTRTGGKFYVDFDKYLHYFSTESNAAAWNLSDTPNFSTTFPFGDYEKVEDASELVNKVYVVGQGIASWVGSGVRQAIVFDNRVTTAQGVTDRGTAIINAHTAAKAVYKLVQWKDGLRAGMSVQVTNSVWGLTATALVIRTLDMECLSADGTLRMYKLELGDAAYTASGGERGIQDTIGVIVEPISEIIFDVDAPTAPDLQIANLSSGVTVDADGHQLVYIQMTWGSVAETDLDYYDAQISTSSDFSSYVISRAQKAGGSRIERFEGVLGNTLYYARVRAVDWVGNASAWSTTRSITTSKDSVAPAQVTGLVAAGARTLIGLTWTRSTEADLAYYEVQWCATAGGSYATLGTALIDYFTDRSFTEAQIQASTTRYYKVRAVDTSGNAGTYSAVANAHVDPLASDSIAADAIIAVKIAAGAVTATKISVSQLSAIAADMGTITAGTVTGATIRTAASGARVQLDSSNGIIVYNASAEEVFRVQVTGAGQIGKTGLNPLAWNAAGQVDKITANQVTLGPGGNNLLANTGYWSDDNADGVPDDWTAGATATHYAITIDTTYYLLAGRALKLALSSTNAINTYALVYQAVTLANLGLRVADNFTFSGYLNTAGMTNVSAKLYINWLTGVGGLIRSDAAATVTTNVDWTRYSITSTVPATAVSAEIVCYLQTTVANGTGSAYFDAIQLERGDLLTAWRPGLYGNITMDGTRIQITDGTDRIFIGKAGTDLGMFGYDGATLQVAWYAAGANAGKVVAGAGAVVLDAGGLTLAAPSAYTEVNSIRWVSGATVVASIGGWEAAAFRGMTFELNRATGKDCAFGLTADVPSGRYGGVGMTMLEDGVAVAQVSAGVTTAGQGSVLISPVIDIPDGVTAPATRTSFARIYIDTADGDLKIKFADGTVKTIVVDT